MDHKYATKIDENCVKALARNLPISKKQSVEIARMIRGKSVVKAQAQLNRVIKMDEAVPFLKHNKHVAHKKGDMAAGRYPIKAASHFLNLLNTLRANARNLNLNDSQLLLKAIVVNKGKGQYHYGRHRGRQHKRTHIELVGIEFKGLDSKKEKSVIDKKDIKVKKVENVKKTGSKVTESKVENTSSNPKNVVKNEEKASKKTSETKTEVKKE